MSRHTTFKFCLDPTVEQREVLARHAGAARFAFNQCLRVVKTALSHRKTDPDTEVPWTGFDLINAFNAPRPPHRRAHRRSRALGHYAAPTLSSVASWQVPLAARDLHRAEIDTRAGFRPSRGREHAAQNTRCRGTGRTRSGAKGRSFMDLGLSGKTFVVTGASEGLGFASARELLREGAMVTVSSRSQSKVADAVTQLSAHRPGAVHGIAADNGDPKSAERVVESALSHWGKLDGLVVSVGGPPLATALGATDEDWESSFHSVFLGTIRLIRAAVPSMTEGGAVVLVLSISVKSPLPQLGISNGLRPGLAMAAKDIADELGPRGIRVVSMLPGLFNTARGAGATSEEVRSIPMGGSATRRNSAGRWPSSRRPQRPTSPARRSRSTAERCALSELSDQDPLRVTHGLCVPTIVSFPDRLDVKSHVSAGGVLQARGRRRIPAAAVTIDAEPHLYPAATIRGRESFGPVAIMPNTATRTRYRTNCVAVGVEGDGLD